MHIKIMTQAVGVCLALLAQQAWAQPAQDSGKVELSPLNVSGEAVSAEQQALEKPGAVSARGPDTRLQPVDQIVRSMPGTFTQIDPAQGAVSVNIRGLSGLGRVNMMVDGVSQNYYGSAPSSVCASPPKILSREDLPAPLRPIRPTRSPASREKVAWSSKATCPKAS